MTTNSTGRQISRLLPVFVLSLLLSIFTAAPLLAAMNCELNYPASDVARLFPESTVSKGVTSPLQNRGGDALLRKVEARLGGAPALFAPLNVPYTLYEVYKGKRTSATSMG